MDLVIDGQFCGGYPSRVATFGGNLKRERERRRITQTQLAEWLGVRQAQISAWEKGRRLPGSESIQRITEALSRVELICQPADLLAGVVTEYDVLRGSATVTPERPSAPTLTATERRALRLLGMASERGQYQALGLLAEVAKAFPRDARRESTARSGQTTSATRRTGRGKRKAAGE